MRELYIIVYTNGLVMSTQNSVALYGYASAGYDTFARLPFEPTHRIYHYQELGSPLIKATRPDGAPLHKIGEDYPHLPMEKRHTWKNGLANLVLMNLLMSEEGKPITPCLFCIDGANTSEASRSAYQLLEGGARPSAREARRIYKLCHDPLLPQEIREMALKTFRFVLVSEAACKAGDPPEACFTPLPFPWKEALPPRQFHSWRGPLHNFWKHELWHLHALYGKSPIKWGTHQPVGQCLAACVGTMAPEEGYKLAREIPDSRYRSQALLSLIPHHLRAGHTQDAERLIPRISMYLEQMEAVRSVAQFHVESDRQTHGKVLDTTREHLLAMAHLPYPSWDHSNTVHEVIARS